jgi:hypothetical protein
MSPPLSYPNKQQRRRKGPGAAALSLSTTTTHLSAVELAAAFPPELAARITWLRVAPPPSARGLAAAPTVLTSYAVAPLLFLLPAPPVAAAAAATTVPPSHAGRSLLSRLSRAHTFAAPKTVASDVEGREVGSASLGSGGALGPRPRVSARVLVSFPGQRRLSFGRLLQWRPVLYSCATGRHINPTSFTYTPYEGAQPVGPASPAPAAAAAAGASVSLLSPTFPAGCESLGDISSFVYMLTVEFEVGPLLGAAASAAAAARAPPPSEAPLSPVSPGRGAAAVGMVRGALAHLFAPVTPRQAEEGTGGWGRPKTAQVPPALPTGGWGPRGGGVPSSLPLDLDVVLLTMVPEGVYETPPSALLTSASPQGARSRRGSGGGSEEEEGPPPITAWGLCPLLVVSEGPSPSPSILSHASGVAPGSSSSSSNAGGMTAAELLGRCEEFAEDLACFARVASDLQRGGEGDGAAEDVGFCLGDSAAGSASVLRLMDAAHRLAEFARAQVNTTGEGGPNGILNTKNAFLCLKT